MAKQTAQRALPVKRLIGGDAASWLICAYLLLIVAAFMLLRTPGVMPRGNNQQDRAFFVATNAATLTGFQLDIVSFNEQPIGGPLIIFGLTLAGALVSLILGGLAVVRILRLPYSDGRVIGAAFVWCLIAIVLGTIFVPSRPEGIEPERHLLASWQMSLAAFANSGVVLSRLPDLQSWQAQLILLPLSVLGGLGLPVLLELWDLARKRRPLSTHSNIVLSMTAGLYIAGVLYFFLMRVPEPPQVIATAASSSTAAINSRSAGFGFEFAVDWPKLMPWLVMLLMIVGAASGGTGGGLKVNTVAELFRGTRRALKGEGGLRPLGIALTWTGIYFLGVAIVFLALLWSFTSGGGVSPVRHEQLLFESISAVSNVGLSFDRVTYTGANLFILSAGMLIGRVAPLVVLWWMAETTRDADVAVG